MIWVRGEIVSDEALTISVLDRTFEHGLGLFETLRTWNGFPTLLPRHRDRLARAADALRLPFDEAEFPNAQAVRCLIETEGIEGDAVLRITLSGGRSESEGGVLWMRARALNDAGPQAGLSVRASWPVVDRPKLAAYKTLNYWERRLVFEQAQADGFDEELGVTPVGTVSEGTRYNLFAIKGGSLRTSAAIGSLLPGILREVVLERASQVGLEVFDQEPGLGLFSLLEVDELFLTNAVRGIVPVARLTVPSHWESQDLRTGHGRWLTRDYPTPGPWTYRLWSAIRPWLESGGTTT